MSKAKAPPANIGRNTPLRLAVAAKLAFPDGGITAKSFRLESSRGRLVIERIAGKDFVTLSAIEDMRRLCQVQNNQKKSGPEGFHSEDAQSALTAALTVAAALRKQPNRGS